MQELFQLHKELEHLNLVDEDVSIVNLSDIKILLLSIILQIIKYGDYEVHRAVFTPWEPRAEKALTQIVVHFTSVMVVLSNDKLCTPFLNILSRNKKVLVSNPPFFMIFIFFLNYQAMYWPSMADDINDMISEATVGTTDSRWGN